jgi:hypothetical protein
MFKKVEIWILYLITLLGILFAIGFGVLVRQELVGSTKAGWLSKSALTLAEIPVNFKKLLTNKFIVEDRFPTLNGFHGTPSSKESYLLLSKYDGNLQEGVVELVDLRNFELLHNWNPDVDLFNSYVDKVDEFKYLQRDKNNKNLVFIHPKLLPDGGLLLQSDTPLNKIDACNNLLFQNTHNLFHHSIETDVEGNIWLPVYLYPNSLSPDKIGKDTLQNGGYFDDGIVKLSPNGDILYEKSVSKIFIENGLEYLLFSVGDRVFQTDPIHLNDIQPVNFDGEFWKKGDVFLSLRHQSMVLLYRPSTNEIIWKGTSPFFHQHDVDIIDEHRISIFNNNSKDFIKGDVVDGYNEVIIYDFKTSKYSSYLKDKLIENDLRTITQGRSQILPNGDLFIEETDYGRTLYYDSDGSVRWAHVNRADDGNVYRLGWSRILYTQEDIQTVNNFLTNKGTCNE